MPGYIGIPVDTNPDDLAQDSYDYLQSQIPGWVPQEGNLETVMIDSKSRIDAEIRGLASRVPKDIFRYLGSIVGLAALEGAKATVNSTWTMINSLGYTIPAGTLVGIRTAGDELVTFEVLIDYVVPPGQTVTTTGGVTLIAIETGTQFNALGAPSAVAELITPLDFVTTVILVAATAGGADAETADEYLDRLAERMSIVAPRPIIPADFSTMARLVEGANVARAVTIDGYNADYNALTANQASAETDATGWGNAANATLASSSAQAAEGTKSVSLTAIAAADMAARTPTGQTLAALPGQKWTGVLSIRANATTRSCKAQLVFRDSGGSIVSGGTIDGSAASDSNTAWTVYTVTGTAPANTAWISIQSFVTGPGIGEVHYVDKATLHKGDSTVWSAGGTVETDNERMITVFPINEDGTALSAGEKAILDAFLEENREVNFIVFVSEPNFAAVSVTYDVLALEGADITDLETRVDAAIGSYLDPTTWGVPPPGSNFGSSQDWINSTKVYFWEMVQVIGSVAEVDRIITLTIGLVVGSMGTTDITLPGVVPVPTVGVITGTVTPA